MKSNTGKTKDILNVWGELAVKLEGLPITILQYPSKELEGTEGIIIKETAKMLHVQTQSNKISIQKSSGVFKIRLSDGKDYIVDGDMLKGLPDTRVKKKLTSW